MAGNSSWIGNLPCPPDNKKPVLITRDLTKTFIFTPENPHSSSLCWNMVNSNRMIFGIFQVPPGGTYGPPTDVHVGDEVYYVLKGTLTELNPETGQCIEVHKGEALLLPKGGYHTAYNFTTKELTILFVIAPKAWEEGLELNFPGKPKIYKWGKRG
jgi:gentisate 1,2-dioxygenase